MTGLGHDHTLPGLHLQRYRVAMKHNALHSGRLHHKVVSMICSIAAWAKQQTKVVSYLPASLHRLENRVAAVTLSLNLVVACAC